MKGEFCSIRKFEILYHTTIVISSIAIICVFYGYFILGSFDGNFEAIDIVFSSFYK